MKDEANLTFRFAPPLLSAVLDKMGLDPRNIPELNHFQQSFCLLLRKL